MPIIISKRKQDCVVGSIFSHLFKKMSAMAGEGGIYNNPTSLIDSLDGGPMSGTENSLWIDQK